MLGKIVKSPYLNIISGLILLITASFETIENLKSNEIQLHHGILIFSIIHVLRTLPEVMHGLKEINSGKNFFQSTKN